MLSITAAQALEQASLSRKSTSRVRRTRAVPIRTVSGDKQNDNLVSSGLEQSDRRSWAVEGLPELSLLGRRNACAAAFAVLLASGSADADDPSEETLEEFIDPTSKFALSKPKDWELTGKAGADALFVDPSRKSTTLGVVVTPVRIDSLEQFGTLAQASERVQATEREKDGFFGITMLKEAERRTTNGALMYDLDYKVETSRGTKTLFSSVVVSSRRLYVFTLTVKEAKEGEVEAAEKVERTKALAKRVAASFDVR